MPRPVRRRVVDTNTNNISNTNTSVTTGQSAVDFEDNVDLAHTSEEKLPEINKSQQSLLFSPSSSTTSSPARYQNKLAGNSSVNNNSPIDPVAQQPSPHHQNNKNQQPPLLGEDVSDLDSSKENNNLSFDQVLPVLPPSRARHSLGKGGVLKDINQNSSSLLALDQSFDIEGAIKGMDQVSLENDNDSAADVSTNGNGSLEDPSAFKDAHLPQSSPAPVAPKERLTIAKLVLTNFKSYAGRQEIGPFHPSFSAVVGPNGSGKSNVIDSLLFVFGFRANKMRHSKISALIHSSAAYPDLNSCTVDVHFQDVMDEPQGTVVVPDSQLVVSRRAFRNNSSKYYINGKESSFQEVTGLLKGRGIDLDHKRFLILQGEVESIAQMKPKAETEHDDGLLEYLEDIIGTSDYKPVIEEAESKVEALNEECSEKQGRLKIVENELNSLESQRAEILKFLETENEISQTKYTLLELSIFNCNQKIEVNQRSLEEVNEKLVEEIAKVSGNTDEIEALQKECQVKSRELEKLKSSMQSLSKTLSKMEIEKVQLEEKKKHVEVKSKKLEKQIETAEFKQREADDWLSNSEQETSGLNAQITQLEESLQKEQAQYQTVQDKLKDQTKVFADEIEQTQQKLGPWREKITNKESELAVATSELDLIREKNDGANQQLQEAKGKVERIMQEGKEKEQQLAELKKEQHYVSEQVVLGTRECGEASQKLEAMKQKLISMRQAVDSAKDAVASMSTQNTVLTSLTKLSQSGRVEGFHGRLGGLGTIDQQFDVAISTACPSLDNFVVDSVDGGQKCVEYLRKNNLGRGKFILLAQLPKKNMQPIQTPENVPRLFDLVKPREDKFAPAFYSVLGDTLVAKDVEQARRIAYGKKRFRVVTLDGVLVDTSGTMSGGGQVLRGGMKSVATSGVSDKELQKMEKEKSFYEQSYTEAEATLSLMQSSLKELQDRKPKIEMEISKTKMDIENLSVSWKEAQAQFKEIQREIKSSRPDTGAIEAVEKRVADITAELDQLKGHSKSLEDKIAELQEKILDAGGVELRMQRAKVDGIREQLDLLNTRISNGVMERKRMQNESKKQAKIVANAQGEIEAGKAELEEINVKLDEKLEAVESLTSELNQASDAHDDKQEELEELKKTLSAKQAEIDELRSTEIELRNTIEEHEKNIAEATAAVKSYLRQQQELKLHDIALVSGRSKADTVKSVEPVVKTEVKEGGEEEDAMDLAEEKMEEDSTDVTDNVDANASLTTSEVSANTSSMSKSSKAGFVVHSEDELRDFKVDSLNKAIANLEAKIKDARVDMQVLKEYQRRLSEYEKRRDDLNDSVAVRDELKKKCDAFRQKRLTEFMAGFNTISSKLKEMYQMITMGGNAELELVDSLDPFSEGILFSVMPPKKSWRNISNLSGGEKTLSSLALVFALHHYKPTPLYVMDEIDAALDFRNVSIVATYIKERTKHGQFIVISLRNNMFELAQQLVGIYKVNNMTKSIALQNKDYIRR